ncbi:MAG TPA: AmmeMemoRadiSam system protein A [Patescibacteria group bacterium]|nr:AmmeMemoRadiSam system protein A [Patescibacteria group bacterium]
MDIFVELARKTIQQYLDRKDTPELQDLIDKLPNQRAACFVSYHLKENDELRGCLGTILPVKKNLADEIRNNAIAACHDSRFTPLAAEEIDEIKIQVDVLSEIEPIESESSLDPKKYGVVVKAKDGRTGLLLPALEGIEDARHQIALARQKAGISPLEPIFLSRFTTERHKE